jgi:riboflavin kinase/FMN adenylyltransferase
VVPTANVVAGRYAAVPADGVYAGTVEIDGMSRPAALSVGAPPSFPGSRELIEAHVLDFDGDLYGRELVVTFATRIRDLAEFPDAGALKARVMEDVATVRAQMTTG